MLNELIKITKASTKRISTWDQTGKNSDFWKIQPGESRVLAEINGPAKITHIWMTQHNSDPDFLREIVLSFTWDNEEFPSILVPLGDFFCLGHSMVNSFQSLPFTASARTNNIFGGYAALNCYLQMPFNELARIELINESHAEHTCYFHIDYETCDSLFDKDVGLLHACFKRENPTTGWAHEITANTPPVDIPNLSDKDNYLILDAEGEGQFIGFNLSVTNFHRLLKNPYERFWWGEGDEMYFIDGEPWPPSIHGTGSEDTFNQAYGMQRNAFIYNGSSIFENDTNGYQTSYIFYLTNPIRFQKSIRASIEHGHANHQSNEYSSVAYWYQKEPHKKFGIIPAIQRIPLRQSFSFPEGSRTPPITMEITEAMGKSKEQWQEHYFTREEPGRY